MISFFLFETSCRIARLLFLCFFSGVMNLPTFVKETTWCNYLKCFRLESSNFVICIVSLKIVYTCGFWSIEKSGSIFISKKLQGESCPPDFHH